MQKVFKRVFYKTLENLSLNSYNRMEILKKRRNFNMLWELKKIWYRIYQKVFKVAMCFMDWSEPQLLEGAGSVLKLPEFIKSKGINKVLVVTDKGLIFLILYSRNSKKLGLNMLFMMVFSLTLLSLISKSARICIIKTTVRAL